MVELRDGGPTLDGGEGDFRVTATSGGGSPSGDFEQAEVEPPPPSAFEVVQQQAGNRLERARSVEGDDWWRVMQKVGTTWTVSAFPTRDEAQARDDYRRTLEGKPTRQQAKVLKKEKERLQNEQRVAPIDGDPKSPSGEAHAVKTDGAQVSDGGRTQVQAASASGGTDGDPFTLVLLVGGAVLFATWRMMDQ